MGLEGYVPLPMTKLLVEAQCQISMGFSKTTMEVYYPQQYRAAPLQLCVPKSTAAVISEVVVENLVRDQARLRRGLQLAWEQPQPLT